MKARLGTVLSNKVQMSRTSESRVIFAMIMELVLRLDQELESSETGNNLLRRRCGSGSSVGCCSRCGRSDSKIEGSGFDSWCRKTYWTSHSKMMDGSIGVDGLAVLWEEVLEFVGPKVHLDGNARHATAHKSAQSNKCLAKWLTVLSSSWLRGNCA